MSRQAPDLDHYTDPNAESYPDQFDYRDQDPDPDEDRRARYGGTDLFRGVIVVLLALVVGGYLLTRSLDAPSGDDTAAADDGVETVDDPNGGDVEGLDPAAPEEAEAGANNVVNDGSTDDSSMADGSMAGDAATEQGMGDQAVGETMDDTTTTTASAVRPPGEVTVQVLNATDRSGIAGQGTDLLSLAGYSTIPAGNAPEPRESGIYYAEGFEAEALAVAETLGTGLDSLVGPLDTTASLSDDPADAGKADIVVVLGTDDAIPI
jgi:hypothetical protein